MMLTNLIISALSGAVGGNALGRLFQKLNLGGLGNSLIGALGGVLGGQVQAMFSVSKMAAPLAGMDGAAGSGDVAAILATLGAGAAGGGGLAAIIGMAKSMMRRG